MYNDDTKTKTQSGRQPGGRAEELISALDRLAALAPSEGGDAPVGQVAAQTLADDFDLPEDKLAVIAQTEAVVREVLKMFDVDYDALIRMDADSPYAQAVKANPQVLDHIGQAENPVLAALQVAVGYKPYAEFTRKYGAKPEEIRAAIRQEMEEELKARRGERERAGERTAARSVPFSGATSRAVNQSGPEKRNIGDFFPL